MGGLAEKGKPWHQPGSQAYLAAWSALPRVLEGLILTLTARRDPTPGLGVRD